MSEIRHGFVVGDKIFDTKAEAVEYRRRPLVDAALKTISGGDANLAAFLATNEDEILKAFESGVVARVTKAEKKKLKAALDHLVTIQDGKLKFLQDNVEAILESFKWPAVKRMTDEEKHAATLAALTQLADANAAAWLMANRKQIENAYAAGIEKRAPPPGTGLQEYLAAKAAGPEALAAYQAQKEARKAEAAAAKKATA